MDKLVTAIITTHNRKELLLKAVNSVLNQSYKNIQCIVVDDASTDGTKECLLDLIKKNKITYIYIEPQNSKGGNHARNIGVENALGEYIAFLDDDDEWYPDKIERQIRLFNEKSDIGMVYCGMDRQYIKHNTVYKQTTSKNVGNKAGDLSREVLIHSITLASSIMVKKNVVEIAGNFDEDLKYWQDYEFCIRIMQYIKVGYIKDALVLYRVFEDDKKRLSNNIDGWEESVRYILNKHAALYEALSVEEEGMRKVYYYIDGINRAKKVRSVKYFLNYIVEILLDKNVLRLFIKKALHKVKNI